jgi:alkylhydroperoxidase family enzyme
MGAISSKVTANMSCRMNATRSAGDSVSRTASSASPTESASSASAVTRLADRPDPVPDAIWDEAARHYDERALAGLLLWIATTNVYNRLNVPTRQVAGVWPKWQ